MSSAASRVTCSRSNCTIALIDGLTASTRWIIASAISLGERLFDATDAAISVAESQCRFCSVMGFPSPEG
ncbi:hypothetical protein ACETU7_11920 [Rhodococcus sp. 3Y1]